MNHLKEWLKIYHDKLSSDLEVFGFDPKSVYPFDALESDYVHYYHFAFVWAIQHVGVRSWQLYRV